jgi:hypothetical protein
MEEYLNPIEKMLDSGYRIIAMESYEVDHVCDLFLELSRHSKKPFYLAQPEQALFRLGASHISIPKTKLPEDLMEYIESSQHFGIYILRSYTEILEDEDMVEDLINIAMGDTHKILVMVAEHIKLPAPLKRYTVQSKHQRKETQQDNLVH